MLRQRWELEAWQRLNAGIAGRAADLAALENREVCEQDKFLPAGLVEQYFQGGKNLACPAGTTSERASWCLGQCVKPQSRREPISILDPLDHNSLTEDLVAVAREQGLYKPDLLAEALARASQENSTDEMDDEAGPPSGGPRGRGMRSAGSSMGGSRRMQEENAAGGGSSSEEVDWSARWDAAPVFKLQPLASATLSLDFRQVPPGFEYNEHYAIILLGRADEAPTASGELEREEWQKEVEGD